jgi:hypothetical protein
VSASVFQKAFTVENGDERTLELANFLLKENHRARFAIPERV